MAMILKRDCKYASVALITVSEVFSASLTTKSAALTVKILFYKAFWVKEYTFWAKIVSKSNFTTLTTLRSLINVIKHQNSDLQVELAHTQYIWCLVQLRIYEVCRNFLFSSIHWVFSNHDKVYNWSNAHIYCKTLHIWLHSDYKARLPTFLNFPVGQEKVWLIDLS